MSNEIYALVDFDDVPAIDCLCGEARRAFADIPFSPGTIHRTEITGEATPHVHRRLTEIYYVLESSPNARLRLDDEEIEMPVGRCVVIPPGTVHAARGPLTILNIVVPKFDPNDEYPA